VDVARAWPHGEMLSTHGLGHRRVLRDPRVVAAVSAFATAAPEADVTRSPAAVGQGA
jgi:hypothetical protein